MALGAFGDDDEDEDDAEAASAGAAASHPLFPRAEGEPETREIHRIRIERRLGRAAESEFCPVDLEPGQLTSWAQIYKMYGGGRYRLRAINRRYQWSKAFPARGDGWHRLAGRSKPFTDDQEENEDVREQRETRRRPDPGLMPPAAPPAPALPSYLPALMQLMIAQSQQTMQVIVALIGTLGGRGNHRESAADMLRLLREPSHPQESTVDTLRLLRELSPPQEPIVDTLRLLRELSPPQEPIVDTLRLLRELSPPQAAPPADPIADVRNALALVREAQNLAGGGSSGGAAKITTAISQSIMNLKESGGAPAAPPPQEPEIYVPGIGMVVVVAPEVLLAQPAPAAAPPPPAPPEAHDIVRLVASDPNLRAELLRALGVEPAAVTAPPCATPIASAPSAQPAPLAPLAHEATGLSAEPTTSVQPPVQAPAPTDELLAVVEQLHLRQFQQQRAPAAEPTSIPADPRYTGAATTTANSEARRTNAGVADLLTTIKQARLEYEASISTTSPEKRVAAPSSTAEAASISTISTIETEHAEAHAQRMDAPPSTSAAERAGMPILLPERMPEGPSTEHEKTGRVAAPSSTAEAAPISTIETERTETHAQRMDAPPSTSALARDGAEAGEPYGYLVPLTAKHRKTDMVEGLDAGANDYVSKPELRVRLRVAARVISLQTELVEARETLRSHQATHDPLTEALNRGAAHQMVGERLEVRHEKGQRRGLRRSEVVAEAGNQRREHAASAQRCHSHAPGTAGALGIASNGLAPRAAGVRREYRPDQRREARRGPAPAGTDVTAVSGHRCAPGVTHPDRFRTPSGRVPVASGRKPRQLGRHGARHEAGVSGRRGGRLGPEPGVGHPWEPPGRSGRQGGPPLGSHLADPRAGLAELPLGMQRLPPMS
jgi:CheY-like chemotaxis protein